MKCSTEALEAMAKLVVKEMGQIGLEGEDIRSVETGMREILREVGAKALGQYLEQQDEGLKEEEVVCMCGHGMTYQFKQEAVIVSVFGRVNYRRRIRWSYTATMTTRSCVLGVRVECRVSHGRIPAEVLKVQNHRATD